MLRPIVPTAAIEDRLTAFVDALPEDTGINARSVVHAWMSGGGDAQVGRLTIRLLSGRDPPFTAGTIHAPRGDAVHPRLELSRVLLEQHGVDWLHWSDEFADLKHHGFDAGAKFPTVTFDERLTAAEVARLVTGVRDLAKMVE